MKFNKINSIIHDPSSIVLSTSSFLSSVTIATNFGIEII